MIAGDQVRVTVFVRVVPADAFEVFTRETDLWWGKGPRYRVKVSGKLTFEPRLGGRLLEEADAPGGAQLFERGRITAWEPPHRFMFEMRASNFAPDEKTEVEVTFTPANDGTNVVLTHRGWSAIRADHPARHGLDVPAFIRLQGSWWRDLLTSLREHTFRE